jgi:hypothetical protein
MKKAFNDQRPTSNKEAARLAAATCCETARETTAMVDVDSLIGSCLKLKGCYARG